MPFLFAAFIIHLMTFAGSPPTSKARCVIMSSSQAALCSPSSISMRRLAFHASQTFANAYS
eukprot:scaffold9935_cov24-Cyclotella_meneghiniana.AAC.4